MPITVKEIAWVAGLLEGEGCFSNKGKTLTITIHMTDYDVLETYSRLVHKALSPVNFGNRRRKDGGELKPVWQCNLAGRDAAQWMMTIYPLMHARRQQKIRETLCIWLANSGVRGKQTDPEYPCGHPRTMENTFDRKRKDGKLRRQCKICNIAQRKRYRHAKKTARLQGLPS